MKPTSFYYCDFLALRIPSVFAVCSFSANRTPFGGKLYLHYAALAAPPICTKKGVLNGVTLHDIEFKRNEMIVPLHNMFSHSSIRSTPDL